MRLVAVLVAGTLVTLVSVGASPGGRAARIEWPSSQYRTLQAAIDAAPDGGTVVIAPGTHHVDEPVVVHGRRLIITGAGSGRNGNARVSQLVGLAPQPVTDRVGNVVSPIEDAQGMFNLIAADVTVTDLRLRGFDAAIVSRADPNLHRLSSLHVTNTVIANTGRGIVALAGALSVRDVTIERTRWHAISVKGTLRALVNAEIRDVFISHPEGAGLYFENANAFVFDSLVTGALEGGIVLFHSGGVIVDSTITLNHRYGIAVVESSATPFLHGNLITDTLPKAGTLGDGVTVVLSSVILVKNWIGNSARAGLSNYGGHAALAYTTLQCAAFDLDTETFFGQAASFEDNGDNSCGCPKATGACKASSSSLEPPKPLDA